MISDTFNYHLYCLNLGFFEKILNFFLYNMRRRCYRDVDRTKISPASPNQIRTSNHRGTKMQLRLGPFI